MNLPPLADAAARAFDRRWVPLAGALLITVMVGLTVFDILRARSQAEQDTAHRLRAQARTIAELTQRSLQSADIVLRHVADDHRSGDVPGGGAAALHPYLRDQAVGVEQMGGLSLFDAGGELLATSWAPLVPPVSLGGRASFQRMRDNPAEPLVVAPAMRSEIDGKWIVPMARRLEGPRRNFLGVVSARVSIEYFQDFYESIQLDRGTKVTLLHRDGTLLARFPRAEAAIGRPYAQLDDMVRAREQHGAVVQRVTSPVDGVERYAVVQAIDGYPLELIVSQDSGAALADWRTQAGDVALRTLVLCALAATLLVMLQRRVVRLDAARASLAASRERFALAVAAANDGVCDWDFAAGSVFASARARELLGLPPGPDVQPIDEWDRSVRFHPDDEPRSRALLHGAGDPAAPAGEGEFRVQQRDGGHRWVRIRCLRLFDETARAVRMAGSVSDIDAAKRAEEALRQSEERYALAMTGLRGGHWVWDTRSDALYGSEQLNELFGVPADFHPGTRRAFFDRVTPHPDDRALLAEIARQLESGEALRHEFEYRILLADGEVRWIATRSEGFPDADGRVARVAGVSIDVTRAKRTEEALRASEERFALAVAGSDDGIWLWDFEAGTAFESRRARELQGLGPGPELQPLPDLEASLRVHPDDRERRRALIQAHLDGRSPAYENEYRVQHDDGQYRWIRVRALCTRGADGRARVMAGSVSDIDARKHAEEALRMSEQRYAIAMAGSNEAHWVWDVQSDEIFASPMLAELFQVAAEAMPTTRSAFFAAASVHPDDRERVQESMQRHLAGDSPRIDIEYRIVDRSDGSIRWIHTRAQAFRDAQGRPERVGGATVDITERKRAEEALRASEERFALAVAGANDGILDWDVVSDRLFASERAMHLLGLPCEGIPCTQGEWAARVMPRIHPDDAQRLRDEFSARRAATSVAHDGEYRVLRADGGYHWVRFRGRSVFDAQGREVRWAGSLSDIDALKQVEEALRRSEERYQLAVLGSTEGLWDWDLRSDQLFLSPRCQELIWPQADEPLQPRRTWIERTVYHPDDRAGLRAALKAHLRGETRHLEVEYRLRHHDGSWHWMRQRGVALRDAAGRPYRMAGSMEDISDRKNAEAERERLELQLRQSQKLEAMGTLAGGIAHDFNNILSAILGYGEMAKKRADEDTPIRRYIDAALSAGQRAKSLVERILAFSRSGMGEQMHVHVQSVVGEALTLQRASLPPGIGLVTRLEAGNAAVYGDPTQLHQVLMNLCANAVQAMGAAGRMEVAVDRLQWDAPRSVTTCKLPPGSYVRLLVRDSGVGIPPRVMERIFDPFFTTKEVGVGTGLGLSLVHGIVGDLGGGIDVASEVGQGTTMTVYLPQSGERAPPTAAAEEVQAGRGETVLLVDDEASLVGLGEEMLADLGYEPVGFASSLAALASFRATPQRFDLVLTDESMPEMTGSELAREIRALRPDIPIVIMTGHVSSGLTRRARELGVADVLSKPLVAHEIARALALALRSTSAAD